jgi:hypothetical protein
MASQEETDRKPEAETTLEQDQAQMAEAWDQFEKEEQGQSTPAVERQSETDKDAQEEAERAGQAEAQAGQPAASSSPDADPDTGSRENTDDDVAKRLEEAERRAERAENLARSNGGRLAKALGELEALKSKFGDKPTEEQSKEIAKEREQLLADYPEVAGPLLKEIDKLQGTVEALGTTATARAEAEVSDAIASEYTVLTQAHPDVGEIVKAPEYAQWLAEQPPAIRRIVEENSKVVVSAADAGKVFADFKRETGWESKDTKIAEAARAAAGKRERQLDAGKSATGGQPGVRSDATKDGSYEDEWDRFERQDKAKAAASRR